ncbi:MAG: SpoIIE family protein phosphatase [Clostridiales bacterium]|nr:SpoIIE family protein phosphatase [Clostridiales bacterium]
MFVWKRDRRRDMAEVNGYTAGRLNGMARSLELLAKSCMDEMESERGLTREDAVAAMQTSAAMVCGSCRKCGLSGRNAAEGETYYLYYLLRTFEQKGRVGHEDMPRLFEETCRYKEDYLAQLNRNLGRAVMNLEWKNRFLESRDTVMVQFRELASLLGEFAHQMEQATDVTGRREAGVKQFFREHHMIVEHMMMLEYENRQREAYLTVRTQGNRCVTAKEAALLFGKAVGGGWYVPPDTRSLITKQVSVIRLAQIGQYRTLWGVAGCPRAGESVSGDNYFCVEEASGQAVFGLSDGMGSGVAASTESRKVIELVQQLLETGFSARAALKMTNTVLLLTGAEQHPATLDLCCIDLHAGVLDMMKMGAAATFVIEKEQVHIVEAGDLPAGAVNGVEPTLISRKLWDGDQIVMMTDGVLDVCPGENKELVMQQFLGEVNEESPQGLAERVLEFARRQERADRDDMTVLTAGIWKR